MSDKIKRVFAAIIDFYTICFLSSALVGIFTLGKFNITPFSITLYLTTFLLFLLIKDFALKKQSLGKRIFKLKIEKTDGTKLMISDVIKRNISIMALLPIEVFLLIIDNKRIGDIWAKTSVVSETCGKKENTENRPLCSRRSCGGVDWC